MPVGNTTSLTTIGNLYDILAILFTNAHSDLRKRKADLQRVRPSDDDLQAYFDFAKEFFVLLRKNFKDLETFFASENTGRIVTKCRGSHGGNALFRPIGLEIFARIVARLTRDMTLAQAVKQAAKLPTTLTAAPYEGLMWDSSNKTILNSHKVTLREVLLYMLGASKYSEATLTDRYRKETGTEDIDLPDQVG